MKKRFRNILFLGATLFAFSNPLLVHNALADTLQIKMMGQAPEPLQTPKAVSAMEVTALSEQEEFYWDSIYFYPGVTNYMSSTTAVLYHIGLHNVPIGDSFTWDVYSPDLDPKTYLPAGTRTHCARGIYTRISEYYWEFLDVFSGETSTYYLPSDSANFSSGPYVQGNDWTLAHPGVWQVTISRNGVPLTTGQFTLIDDIPPGFSLIMMGTTTLIGPTSPLMIYYDNVEVTKIELYADNLDLETSYLVNEYVNPTGTSFSWDTSNYPDGNYIFRPTAYDPYGNVGSRQIQVTVINGVPPDFPEETMPPSDLRTLTKDPVNIATGEAYFSATDISLGGPGPKLSLSRKYRSFSTFSGIFGYGWRTDFDVNLTQDESGNVTIINGEGTGIYFTNHGAYIHSPGNYSKLVQNEDETFTLKDKNGIVTVYGANGQLVSRTDRNGNTLTFVADQDTAYIQDSSGRRIDLYFDPNGHVVSAVDPAGKTFQYGYDTEGNLVSVTDPEGKTASYEYDSTHKIVTSVNPNGHNTYFEYDELGRVYTNGQAGDVNRVTLDYQDNNTTVVTDSLGNNNTYVFNDAGLQISHNDPLGNVTQQTWDYAMNLTSVTDARENLTIFKYDQKGNLIQVTDPLGKQTQMTYTSDFNLISAKTDALGQVTSFVYDNKGNLMTVIDALGNEQAFLYDQFGNVIKSTDSRNNSTNFTYNALGHIIQETDALGNKTHFTYK